MEKKKKPEETKLNCYGCGAVGFNRSNCPTCNYKTVLESPKEMDFNSIQTNIDGRNVPTVEINVNGLKGEAYLDTAARTSIAGYYLYNKLLEKKVKFHNVNVNQAKIIDGQPSSSKSSTNDFMSWFESNNKINSETPTLKSIYSPQNDYSPGGIFKIFKDSLPEDFEMPKEQDKDLFPPLKKKKTDTISPSSKALKLNAIDFNICLNERSHINDDQKNKLIKLLISYEEIFENICSPIKGIKLN